MHHFSDLTERIKYFKRQLSTCELLNVVVEHIKQMEHEMEYLKEVNEALRYEFNNHTLLESEYAHLR